MTLNNIKTLLIQTISKALMISNNIKSIDDIQQLKTLMITNNINNVDGIKQRSTLARNKFKNINFQLLKYNLICS